MRPITHNAEDVVGSRHRRIDLDDIEALQAIAAERERNLP